MSNPVVEAFFFGRALAEVLKEKVEETLTNGLSELGKFDAEQRENLRQFTEQVKIRAERAASQQVTTNPNGQTSPFNDSSEDLQETIDELRAEIASLRNELNKYRS
jgi:siroheme synthase (precorrin-2 oxidase/ferrochelatase)